MKNYKSEYGFHTPTRTKRNFKKIAKATKISWSDASWHNDVCDSMEHHIVEGIKFIQIFLPNSNKYDESKELYNTYSINDSDQNELLNTEDISEVIDYINKFTLTQEITKRIIRTHNDQDIKNLQEFNINELQVIYDELIEYNK